MPSSPPTIIEHTSSAIPCALNAVPARIDPFPNAATWLRACLARPAAQKAQQL